MNTHFSNCPRTRTDKTLFKVLFSKALSVVLFSVLAACVIGGPIAALLIRRGGLKAENKRDLDIGVPNEGRAVRMDYFCILWSILALNVTVLIGLALHEAITAAGVSSVAISVIPGTTQAASSNDTASTSHTATRRISANTAVRITLLI